MGVYIDVAHGAGREAGLDEWLALHAEPRDFPEWPTATGMLLLCRVWNDTFSAVGIVYNEAELRRFVAGIADRRVAWYVSPLADVRAIQPRIDMWLAS